MAEELEVEIIRFYSLIVNILTPHHTQNLHILHINSYIISFKRIFNNVQLTELSYHAFPSARLSPIQFKCCPLCLLKLMTATASRYPIFSATSIPLSAEGHSTSPERIDGPSSRHSGFALAGRESPPPAAKAVNFARKTLY